MKKWYKKYRSECCNKKVKLNAPDPDDADSFVCKKCKKRCKIKGHPFASPRLHKLGKMMIAARNEKYYVAGRHNKKK